MIKKQKGLQVTKKKMVGRKDCRNTMVKQDYEGNLDAFISHMILY